jgi:hypothetical protein
MTCGHGTSSPGFPFLQASDFALAGQTLFCKVKLVRTSAGFVVPLNFASQS